MSAERSAADEAALVELTEQLLARDHRAHEAALAELAERGDERVIPHLVEVLMIDAIANNWGEFGFPEVLRARAPPRYLELPEVAWPGVVDALRELAEPDWTDEIAWVRWESWYSQQDIEPLKGFDDWKRRLFKSFLPPVGSLLDAEPMAYDLQELRYGNADRSFLAALNFPEFTPGTAVDVDEDGGEHDRYLADEMVVYGFEVGGQPYAVPRMVLFPHEFMNADLQGRPVMLAWCTLCNAPILYDRRVGDRTLVFGNTGLLWQGNKVMYDEETESLWAHHSGRPMAGHYRERFEAGDAVTLDILPVSQTEWGDWKAHNPETLVPHLDTGYGYDYRFYQGNVGFFHHYWDREDVTQPGVKRADEGLPEKESVYGITGSDPSTVHVYPLAAVREHGPLVDEIGDRQIIVLSGVQGDDVAAYEAPTLPVEREGDHVIDADGTRWQITRHGLLADDTRLPRVSGRHGLWFAFRTQYDDRHIVTGDG